MMIYDNSIRYSQNRVLAPKSSGAYIHTRHILSVEVIHELYLVSLYLVVLLANWFDNHRGPLIDSDIPCVNRANWIVIAESVNMFG